MNIERLQHLITVLEGIPTDNFDLSGWTQSSIPDDANQQELIECGTVCCAVGWACLDPKFNAEGLTWDDWKDSPEFGSDTSWDAVELFFGIRYAVAETMFSDESYAVDATPQDVIERIREVIESNT